MAQEQDNLRNLAIRPRRLRRGQALRDALAEVRLHPDRLIWPLFVRQGHGLHNPIASMPGVFQVSPDVATEMIRGAVSAGLRQFILFGVTDAGRKDATGSAALDASNPVNATLRSVRGAGLDAVLYADLCLCEYTSHGHCGVLDQDPAVTVSNDATLEPLGRQALLLAESGADVVAPSGMMDGQVRAIRRALDGAGRVNTAIMSYSVKFASSLYGPFREAGEGAPTFGDRRGYQMDYRRRREWALELKLDLAEGADMVMVKPAATYLDVIQRVREACDVPVVAYHVSGEYAMLHAAAEKGWLDLKSTALETTTAIHRAGADLVISYFARDLVDWLS